MVEEEEVERFENARRVQRCSRTVQKTGETIADTEKPDSYGKTKRNNLVKEKICGKFIYDGDKQEIILIPEDKDITEEELYWEGLEWKGVPERSGIVSGRLVFKKTDDGFILIGVIEPSLLLPLEIKSR